MSRWPNEEDAPSEEELRDDWELDPNDPTHPDHDLSEDSGYAYWEPRTKPFFLRRGFVLLVSVLVIIGLMWPLLRILT